VFRVLPVTYSIHYGTDSLRLDALKFLTEQIHCFYVAGDSLQNNFFDLKYPAIHYQTNSLVLHSQRFITEKNLLITSTQRFIIKQIPWFYIAEDSLQDKFVNFKYLEINYRTSSLVLRSRGFIAEQIY